MLCMRMHQRHARKRKVAWIGRFAAPVFQVLKTRGCTMEIFDSMCMGFIAARCNVLYFGACILCKFNIFIIYY
jgi:hypothetical protein